MAAPQRFKVVLTGDGGVGKTTLLHRHLTGDFKRAYVATLGVDVHPLTFNTNYGTIVFDVWDTAGQDKFGGLVGGYALAANAVIGMCDVTSPASAHNLSKWYSEMGAAAVPSVACGNKCDLPTRLTIEEKTTLKEQWGQYYDISAKSNYNYEKPFLYLAQRLTGHKDLQFVPSSPVLAPVLQRRGVKRDWHTAELDGDY